MKDILCLMLVCVRAEFVSSETWLQRQEVRFCLTEASQTPAFVLLHFSELQRKEVSAAECHPANASGRSAREEGCTENA